MPTLTTSSVDQRVRLLGQMDLGAAAQILTGEDYWSIQKQVATALSVPRAKVAVPSCNASGKTWLAARLALAFYNAFTPGTPCAQCGGPCRGSKVITTSSKWEHLRDNLWGEIRSAYPKLQDRGFVVPGKLAEADLRLVESESNHYIIGQSAASAEGLQGAHAAHKLIIGDEATSVDDEVQLAINRLLASSDSRILLIYNPTTPDTYASKMARSPAFERIKITAFDTPGFTGEHVPEGSNLITPAFLDDLRLQGMGEGTFEWTTSILAEDWDLGDDLLIPSSWYQNRSGRTPELGRGTRQLGIDLATYGSDESVIVMRDGDQIVEVRSFNAGRVDAFVQGPVTRAVQDFAPHVVVFDGDGPGAGAIGYFEDLKRHMQEGGIVIPFRGGKGHHSRFINQRSAWYWSLRRRFESGAITVAVSDDKLHEQLTDIHYTLTPQGDIRVETKSEMRKRGMKSPDRADAVMYAFAYSDDFPLSATPPPTAADVLDLPDHSPSAMWERLAPRYHSRQEVNPVLGCSDDY